MASDPGTETVTDIAADGDVSRGRAYQLLTEVELVQMITNRSVGHTPRTMFSTSNYSERAFILQTAAHNQLIHENIPPGSFVMIDPRVQVTEECVVAFAMPEHNSIALGVRDSGWDGYFLSFGGRAVHITSKRCIPLWPAVAVVGYDL